MEKLYEGIDIHNGKLAGFLMNKYGDITKEYSFPLSKKTFF